MFLHGKKMLRHKATLLVDTGPAFSLVSDKIVPFRNWTPRTWKTLEGFNEADSQIGFSEVKKVQIGNKLGRVSFSLPKLSRIGIIGNDILEEFRVIIDYPIYCLWTMRVPDWKTSPPGTEGNKIVQIPANHWCTALKAKEDLCLPVDLPEYVAKTCLEFLNVWAKHKLQCGYVLADILITSPDPASQWQYWYPHEAEEDIKKMIVASEQEVIMERQSKCNTPVLPVRKADGVTWRLIVDYSSLNRVTSALAPIIVRYSKEKSWRWAWLLSIWWPRWFYGLYGTQGSGPAAFQEEDGKLQYYCPQLSLKTSCGQELYGI